MKKVLPLALAVLLRPITTVVLVVACLIWCSCGISVGYAVRELCAKNTVVSIYGHTIDGIEVDAMRLCPPLEK